MSQSRANAVQEAIESIKQFHSIGSKIPKKTSHKDAYASGVIDAVAEKYKLNPDTARKARHFADPIAGYSAAELSKLCALVQKLQKDQDDGKPVFGRTHVMRMLSVPKSERESLQREAMEGAWSLAMLEEKIAERYGTRGDGGRPRRVASGGDTLLTQLDNMCESWRRWHQAVEPDEHSDPSQSGTDTTEEPTCAKLTDLPQNVRAHVRAALAAITTLHATVTKELARLHPDRSLRQQFRPITEPDAINGKRTANSKKKRTRR